jgi:hypothetical protein
MVHQKQQVFRIQKELKLATRRKKRLEDIHNLRGGVISWYVFQICSRKAKWIGYKLKRALVALIGYILTVALLAAGQGIPTLEAVGLGY